MSNNRGAGQKIPRRVVTLFVKRDRDFESNYDTEVQFVVGLLEREKGKGKREKAKDKSVYLLPLLRDHHGAEWHADRDG